MNDDLLVVEVEAALVGVVDEETFRAALLLLNPAVDPEELAYVPIEDEI